MYKHIVHAGGGSCMKKYTIQICFPVCDIIPHSNKYGYEQIAHYS